MPTRSLTARCVFVGLALAVLAGEALAGPALAQEPQGIVRFRLVDDETGAESVARLDFGRLAGGQTYVLVTQLLPPEAPGEAGTYKVFAGFVERGGLGNAYARVYEAKDSFQMLKRPGVLLRDPASLKPGFFCQIELSLQSFPFTCWNDGGSTQAGRILPLRTAPPVAGVVREEVPGYYRVLDEEGGEALARLELHDVTSGSRALLTLFSRPEGPDDLGTYKVFAGHVAPRGESFRASVRELRNPYGALLRPVLLPALPEEALVPGFVCGLSAAGSEEILYSCQDGGVLTQSGRMVQLR
jgi:hypothetical protein